MNYHPKLHYLAEWWKQLFGEEGKELVGIFPAAVDFTADLHSMGQWIQEGERTIFETVISIKEPNQKVLIPRDERDLDGLNFLEGKRVDEVNKMAELGTRVAHVDGGVPNLLIEMPQLNEKYLGQLIYFFEKACGISGYLLGVNPFNQPGVEAYKKTCLPSWKNRATKRPARPSKQGYKRLVPVSHSEKQPNIQSLVIEKGNRFDLPRSQLLAATGVLQGVTAQEWLIYKKKWNRLGAIYADEAVIIYNNLITSREPEDIPSFVDALEKVLLELPN